MQCKCSSSRLGGVSGGGWGFRIKPLLFNVGMWVSAISNLLLVALLVCFAWLKTGGTMTSSSSWQLSQMSLQQRTQYCYSTALSACTFTATMPSSFGRGPPGSASWTPGVSGLHYENHCPTQQSSLYSTFLLKLCLLRRFTSSQHTL